MAAVFGVSPPRKSGLLIGVAARQQTPKPTAPSDQPVLPAVLSPHQTRRSCRLAQAKKAKEPTSPDPDTVMGVDSTVRDLLLSITSLDKLTCRTLNTLKERCRERVKIPDLKKCTDERMHIQVDVEKFHDWYGEVVEGGCVGVEYHADLGEIIVVVAPSELHQGLEKIMASWFDYVGAHVSTPSNTYSSCRQSEISLRDSENGTIKIVDACLMSSSLHKQFPLIAVEVGFTQPLADLFDDAERLFRGSYGKIQVVILIKIYETNRHNKNEFPWGIQAHDIDSLRTMDKAEALAPAIEQWYHDQKLALIGDLEVQVCWYHRCRKSRPTPPIYEFKRHPHLRPPLGSFVSNFKKGPGTYLDDKFRLELEGQRFTLPMKELEDGLCDSINREKNRWISGMIKDAGV